MAATEQIEQFLQEHPETKSTSQWVTLTGIDPDAAAASYPMLRKAWEEQSQGRAQGRRGLSDALDNLVMPAGSPHVPSFILIERWLKLVAKAYVKQSTAQKHAAVS